MKQSCEVVPVPAHSLTGNIAAYASSVSDQRHVAFSLVSNATDGEVLSTDEPFAGFQLLWTGGSVLTK